MFTVAPVYFDSLSIFYLLSSKHGLSILGIKASVDRCLVREAFVGSVNTLHSARGGQYKCRVTAGAAKLGFPTLWYPKES